ncbi:MAG: amino acid ABC transporter substrate-binding protein [Thermoleophilaceae bacterium]|nr:amino acid ABC transporter substrate-binding protein [Thermoleophilaceae bacterium]
MTKLKVMLLPALAATALLAACGGEPATDTVATGDGGGVQTIEAGTLIVGSDIPYEPFEGGDAPDYEGFDIDIINGVADRLELELEIIDTPFDTIFRDLGQDKFDMVASATTITPEREKEVAFSSPYFQADQSLMVKEGSDIASVEDLAGRTIGAQKGTTGATYAEDETEAADVRTYPEIVDAFNALQNEQIEAVINDFAISKFAEESKPELTVIEAIPTDESYGLAVALDNTTLLDAVDAALAEMITDGSYAEIYEEWFDEQPPEGFREGE